LEQDGIHVVVEDDPDNSVRTSPDGTVEIDLPDGGVSVQFGNGADTDQSTPDIKDMYRNLADDIGQERLALIAEELLEQIGADDNSRKETLANRATGLALTGLQLEQPKSGVGDSASAADGMSVVTNPLLLEACLKAWANAMGEFLPADGPCKIEDEGTSPSQELDELADAFERDMNFFLTNIATEYYPDTSHMLLWGNTFGGSGIKKVSVDPQLRRPSSQSVDIKDFIVSDTTKDLKTCQRMTHVITMRPSVLKRLQMRGYYREVKLAPATAPEPNVVDQKIAAIQGASPVVEARPEDMPYTLYETQCELNLPEFEQKPFVQDTGFAERQIPLPFLVTIETDSREVLAVRRDWKPDDEECARKRMYVKYPYVPGPGFYGTGLLNILGNSSAAMTAAWRLALDAAMYGIFPGGVVAEIGGRQKSNTLRPAPGEFTPIQTNGRPISEVISGLPYKGVSQDILTLMDKITAQAKEAAGSVEIPVKEGVKDIPVGTMLAYVEQASQVMLAVHKGQHTAQSEEIELLVDLFREDPESFWRGNKKYKKFWDEQKLFQALNTYSLVPKSDPNVPSHVHRIMKAMALIQLLEVPDFKPRLSVDTILNRVLRAMKEDTKGLVVQPPPVSTQPTPEQIAAQAKLKDSETKANKVQVDAARVASEAANRQEELAGEERVETLRLAQTSIAHAADNKKAVADSAHKAATHGLEVAQAVHDATVDHHDMAMDRASHALDVHQATNPPEPPSGDANGQ
jgi:hypothetical protein